MLFLSFIRVSPHFLTDNMNCLANEYTMATGSVSITATIRQHVSLSSFFYLSYLRNTRRIRRPTTFRRIAGGAHITIRIRDRELRHAVGALICVVSGLA